MAHKGPRDYFEEIAKSHASDYAENRREQYLSILRDYIKVNDDEGKFDSITSSDDKENRFRAQIIYEDYKELIDTLEVGGERAPKYLSKDDRDRGRRNPEWERINAPDGPKAQALIRIRRRAPEWDRFVGES